MPGAGVGADAAATGRSGRGARRGATSRTALRRRLARPPRAPALAPEAVVAAVRAMLDALPEEARAAVVRDLKRALRAAPARRERTRLEPGEAEREADVAVEVMTQDARVRRRTAEWSRRRWRRLVRCFHDHVLARLRGLERRGFPSRRALDQAVGDAALEAIEALARDPARWLAKHCPPRRSASAPPGAPPA